MAGNLSDSGTRAFCSLVHLGLEAITFTSKLSVGAIKTTVALCKKDPSPEKGPEKVSTTPTTGWYPSESRCSPSPLGADIPVTNVYRDKPAPPPLPSLVRIRKVGRLLPPPLPRLGAGSESQAPKGPEPKGPEPRYRGEPSQTGFPPPMNLRANESVIATLEGGNRVRLIFDGRTLTIAGKLPVIGAYPNRLDAMASARVFEHRINTYSGYRAQDRHSRCFHLLFEQIGVGMHLVGIEGGFLCSPMRYTPRIVGLRR